MASAALLNKEPHSFENGILGFLDGIPEPVYSRKILAIGVVIPAFAFDRDGVGVQLHDRILSLLGCAARRVGLWSPVRQLTGRHFVARL